MPQKITIEQLVKDAGYSDEAARLVLDDIRDQETADDIIAGKLVLPHPTDAEHHYIRKEVEAGRRSLHEADPNTVRGLIERLQQLESRLASQQPKPPTENAPQETTPDAGTEEA